MHFCGGAGPLSEFRSCPGTSWGASTASLSVDGTAKRGLICHTQSPERAGWSSSVFASVSLSWRHSADSHCDKGPGKTLCPWSLPWSRVHPSLRSTDEFSRRGLRQKQQESAFKHRFTPEVSYFVLQVLIYDMSSWKLGPPTPELTFNKLSILCLLPHMFSLCLDAPCSLPLPSLPAFPCRRSRPHMNTTHQEVSTQLLTLPF